MVADAELKYTQNGAAVANIKIAVDRRFKSESGEKQTDFIECVLWKQRAEFAANYLGKGRLVAVNGSIQVRSWVKQDGSKAYKTEILVDEIKGLDRPKQESETTTSSTPGSYDDADLGYDPFAED
jgi:single-strand DNA-binding protein